MRHHPAIRGPDCIAVGPGAHSFPRDATPPAPDCRTEHACADRGADRGADRDVDPGAVRRAIPGAIPGADRVAGNVSAERIAATSGGGTVPPIKPAIARPIKRPVGVDDDVCRADARDRGGDAGKPGDSRRHRHA